MSNDFTTNYDLYYDSILRYCVWKSRDKDVGHDLAQETFLRFWVYLQRNEEIVYVRAFLYRIAHNLFVNHIRRKKEVSLDHLLESGFEPTVDAWHQTYSHLDVQKPLQKLAKMPAPYKEALHSRYILGLLPSEIATEIGETANTVSVRIFRGLHYLRCMLNETSPMTAVAA